MREVVVSGFKSLRTVNLISKIKNVAEGRKCTKTRNWKHYWIKTDQDSCQTQEELARTLGLTQQAISHRLESLGMIYKQGNWVPYELTPRNVEHRFSTCEMLLDRHIWWDQLGFVYYELLKPNATITKTVYRTQLMRLSQAFKEKRAHYYSRHDNVSFLHDNARPHVAVPVKTYLELLKWEVLPHQTLLLLIFTYSDR